MRRCSSGNIDSHHCEGAAMRCRGVVVVILIVLIK